MPKGSKRRKTAKKNMENQSDNYHSSSAPAPAPSVGDECVKHDRERDDDIGEVSSPASQVHHNRNNPLTEVELEETQKKNEGSRTTVKPVQTVSSSGNSSDDEAHDINYSRATDDSSSEVKIIQSVDSEKVSPLDEQLKSVLPYNAPSATTDNGSENERDSADMQPLLHPSASPVQKASWRSCCGLFEVFSGSGR
ncbi:adenylate kinase [Striga asiatica]|uniref:Adenylate kinase n=1 Tax=Striga asiatica TaxID=4170 RepID=A0A5A7QCY2_STRAF|nr:adenylate kinase [Striga asiatica]